MVRGKRLQGYQISADYAMMLIGARLGMRIGDITNLKLRDIDWDNKEISMIQNKTKEPLILSLPNDVGWDTMDILDLTNQGLLLKKKRIVKN